MLGQHRQGKGVSIGKRLTAPPIRKGPGPVQPSGLALAKETQSVPARARATRGGKAKVMASLTTTVMEPETRGAAVMAMAMPCVKGRV